jgi:hypothetical protein
MLDIPVVNFRMAGLFQKRACSVLPQIAEALDLILFN